MTPGRPVLLEPAARAARRTRFTLALVPISDGYVSVDAHLPNALVRAGVGVRAFTCRVTPHGVWLTRSIPVRIPSGRRAVSEAYPVPERD
jgi:DNA-binding sugar fermentation-stimulating protein